VLSQSNKVRNLGFSFGPCCDAHDECYGICLTSQSACDNEFGNCLDRACDPCRADPLLCDATLCSRLAYLYYYAVAQNGEPHWKEGQVAGCACCGILPSQSQ